jgi:molybdate transport system substrate-binding protein
MSAPGRRAAWRAVALVALVAAGLLGCKRTEPSPAAAERTLVVFAAASLREAFGSIGRDFERSHPGDVVAFNFAGTQELRTQLEHGAAADVFASADQRHMGELVRAERVETPVVFARNEPVIVVSSEAVGLIREFAELPRASRIVIGTPEVPIGGYTLQILARASTLFGVDFAARVEEKVVSRELNVRQVLAKVSMGEAQAGVVYGSDARAAAGKARVVRIPSTINVIAEYPIAVVSGSRERELAREWIALVLSAEGQRALIAAGFIAPATGGAPP